MIIEILYFPDCPNYQPAVEHLQTALEHERVSAEIKHVEVSDSATAAAIGFLGSPSIRINGVDLELPTGKGGASGLCCRTYQGPSGRFGAPSVELIREAIRRSAATEEGACCR